jgi:glycosyltransferase involved in cell wall biosynthesis
MRLLFIHDHPFYQDGEIVYTSSCLPRTVWQNNYLPYFDHITVIGRLNDQHERGEVSSIEGKVDFILIPGCRPMTPLKLFLNHSKIKKIITEEIDKAAVVVVRLPSNFGNMAIPILHEQGKPFFVEQVANTWEALWNHGSFAGKLCANYYHWMNKKHVRKAPHVVYVARKLQRDYPTAGHTTVISNVIIPEIMTAGEIKPGRFNHETIKIGLIGAFSVRFKGQDVLLKAISLLDKQVREHIELYFIGGGDAGWITKLAGKLDLKDNIKLMGPVPHEQIFDLLRELSLYVQPSSQEGMPRAMLEAMSVGCPVLGSTIGGIPDVLEPELLHEPGDYRKLSNQIERFYNDRDYLQEQAIRSLEKVAPFLKSTLSKKRESFFNAVLRDVKG